MKKKTRMSISSWPLLLSGLILFCVSGIVEGAVPSPEIQDPHPKGTSTSSPQDSASSDLPKLNAHTGPQKDNLQLLPSHTEPHSTTAEEGQKEKRFMKFGDSFFANLGPSSLRHLGGSGVGSQGAQAALDKRFMRGVDAYIQAGKKDSGYVISEPEKKFMRGVDAYMQAGKKDTGDIPEKKFMRGVDAYMQAGKKDTRNIPEKKFMRGVDAYMQAGKKDSGLPISEPEKKFMRGVDAYMQAGKKDTGLPISEPEKKFMRGVDAYIQAGKKDTGDVPEKKFMRGVDAYMQAGKKDSGLSISEPEKKFMRGVDAYIQAGKKDHVSIPEKKFMRGIDSYIQAASTKPDFSLPEKKFMRGIDAYFQPADANSKDTFTNQDKRFMRGIGAYLQADNRNSPETMPDKRFMRGFDAYIQAANENSEAPVATPQKKFIQGLDAYFQSGNENHEQMISSPDKKFMRGVDAYIQAGKKSATNGDEEINHLQLVPGEKRFIKGIDLYLTKNQPATKKQAEGNTNLADNSELGIDSVADTGEGHDKRFMKGFEHFGKKSVADPSNKNTEHTVEHTALEKKFMRGIDAYLLGSGDSSRQTGHENMKRNSADSSSEVDKRFLKGIDHYLQYSSSNGKRSSDETGITGSGEELESQLKSEDKRFLKGINPYLLHHSSSPQHSERVKRSMQEEEDEPTEMNKRFLRGPNSYLQFYANRYLPAKRFMKIPYLLDHSQSMDTSQMDDVKRSESDGENEGSDIEENKRFMRGIDKYLSAYVNNQPSKRFMKGVNPYLQAYSLSLGSKRVSPFSFVDKRFMKGINPYLQAYYTSVGTKRQNLYNTQKEKRFLKGVNPYLQAFSSGLEDKRLGTEETLFWGPPNKRFMRGADPYLLMYLNHPDVKRVFADEENEGFGDEDDQNTLTAQKRFLKGNNPYMLDFILGQSLKRQHGYAPGVQKRFLRGVDQYLLDYANMSPVKPMVQRRLNKRFIKNVDYYLQLYNQLQKEENAGPGMKLVSSARFKRDAVSEDNRHGARYKRFLRGVNPYLQTYTNSMIDKRFMRGIDYYLNTVPENKRFLKGVGPYLEHFANQGKRNDGPDHVKPQEDATSEMAQHSVSSDSSKLESQELKDENKPQSQNSSLHRSKRSTNFQHLEPSNHGRSKRTASIPYFGLTGNFHTTNDAKSTKEKRFMRGLNPYLHAFSSSRRTPGGGSSIETDAGDALVQELVKETAEDDADSVRDTASEPINWNIRDSYASFPRQPYYADAVYSPRWGQSKRVFSSPQKNQLPRYGARQFMIWNNGDYHLG